MLQKVPFHNKFDIQRSYDRGIPRTVFSEALANWVSTPKRKKKRRRIRTKSSPLWQFLDPLPDGRKQCKFCDKIFAESTSLCSGARHYQLVHHRPTGVTPPRSGNEPRQSSGQIALDMQQKKELDHALLEWILDDKQSFAVSSNNKFKRFVGKKWFGGIAQNNY